MATRVRAGAAERYEADFYDWALSQAEALRGGRAEELDLEHLAEEIEGLAIAIRSAVRSRTRTIMEHLLKLEYSPAQEPRNSWRATVRRARGDLHDDLTPSLRRELEEALPELYARTRADTAATLCDYGESEAAERLPAACPYDFEALLGNWLPDEHARPA